MLNILKDYACATMKGLSSIGEGMATFTLWPSREPLRSLRRSTIEEAMAKDWNALSLDYSAVAGDFNRALEKVAAEKQVWNTRG